MTGPVSLIRGPGPWACLDLPHPFNFIFIEGHGERDLCSIPLTSVGQKPRARSECEESWMPEQDLSDGIKLFMEFRDGREFGCAHTIDRKYVSLCESC